MTSFRENTPYANGERSAAAVPFVDLNRHHEPMLDELQGAWERVTSTSSFTLGEEVARFEAEFAAYCGVAHCVGVGSGTAALTLTLVAAGVGAGDEVLLPAHTFIASALAVIHAGATPVFGDVEEGTGLLDLESAAAAVGPRTAAILPVHLYGQVCDMDAVRALAARHGLFVLEDAAQAHGATWRGRRAGSLGSAGAFSYYPSKNLGALGDGGAVCTNDDLLAERVRQLRHLGQRRKGEHLVVGYNERLDGMQAAFLRVKLRHLDRANRQRRRHAAAYRRLLGDAIGMLAERPESPCVYHLFPIRVANRDAVAAGLAAGGVQTGVHYTPALHHQPPFAERFRARLPLPAAEAWAREELSLPMFPELTEREVERVAARCRRLIERPSAAVRA